MNEHNKESAHLIEQVLDTELDYVTVLVDGVEVDRGSADEMMLSERAIRDALQSIGLESFAERPEA